jgi:hypothetical protein
MWLPVRTEMYYIWWLARAEIYQMWLLVRTEMYYIWWLARTEIY